MAEAVSAFVAVAALLFATYQFRRTQGEARRTAAFTHLREIMANVEKVRPYQLEPVFDEIVAHFRDGAALSDAGTAQLRLLDSLELVSLAIAKDAIDPVIARTFLEASFGSHVADYVRFINRFRGAMGEPRLYQYLYDILPTLLVPAPAWACVYDPPPEPSDGPLPAS